MWELPKQSPPKADPKHMGTYKSSDNAARIHGNVAVLQKFGILSAFWFIPEVGWPKT